MCFNLRSENSHVDACTALHERWQANQKQWFGGAQAEAEKQILVTEESFRRAKASSSGSSGGASDPAYNHRHLRYVF